MREIKFKAKTCNGKWVEGLLAHKDNKWYISNKAGMPFAFEVRPETISQYIGLKDKNGKEIWENDIINYGFHNEKGIVRFGTHENVSSKNQGFYVEWINKWCSYRQDLGYFADIFEASVIGNIFDNPELLDVDKQASKYADNDVMKPAT